jgi:transcriptional regulator with XRE-family HTH domain
MLQREVAEQIGVDHSCITNWEGNTSSPDGRFIPAIIDFLGYNPLPPAAGLAEELVRQRTTLGLTQKDAAGLASIPSTLAKWERAEREPAGKYLDRVQQFLERKSPPKHNAA